MALTRTMLFISGVAATLCSLSATQAAVVYSENFNSYADGTQLTSPSFGATALSAAGTNAITINNGSVTLANSGEDDIWSITSSPISSGSVYYHATINLASAQTGDYFMGLGANTSNSYYYARLFAKASGSGYVIGVNSGSVSTSIVYGSTVYSFGTNIDVVVSYDIVDGANNDTSTVYVSTDGATYSNIASATNVSTTAIDAASIGSAFLRQGSALATPVVTVDNLVVGTSFDDVVGTAAPVPEPATIGVLGLSGLLLLARRRQA